MRTNSLVEVNLVVSSRANTKGFFLDRVQQSQSPTETAMAYGAETLRSIISISAPVCVEQMRFINKAFIKVGNRSAMVTAFSMTITSLAYGLGFFTYETPMERVIYTSSDLWTPSIYWIYIYICMYVCILCILKKSSIADPWVWLPSVLGKQKTMTKVGLR